jgi:Phage Mu protein F like protein
LPHKLADGLRFLEAGFGTFSYLDLGGGYGIQSRLTAGNYQTNMATSYAAGRYAQLTDPDFVQVAPYWRYVHDDSVWHPRPEHQAWGAAGLTLRYDDPFWETHFPPNGWGCQCRVVPVEAPEKGDATKPPDGWNERDGKGNLPGVDKGFDYAPGQNRTALDRMLLDPKLSRLFGDVTPSAIAHGAAPDSIERVLKDFLPEMGESVPHFKSLANEAGAPYKMATYGDGRYMGDESGEYMTALRDALRNIRQGARLPADQEGMIKTLWHEIGHNRQIGLTTRTYIKGSANETLLETTNEFIALRTYPQFLRSIGGGEAQHLAEVRALSGYGSYVQRLERVMEAVGLKPDALLAEVERVSFQGAIDDGHGGTLLKSLSATIATAGRAAGYKGLTGPNISKVLGLIHYKTGSFERALSALSSKKP